MPTSYAFCLGTAIPNYTLRRAIRTMVGVRLGKPLAIHRLASISLQVMHGNSLIGGTRSL
jgi:hypothetical protein